MAEIRKVRKRDGRLADFDAERIVLAAAKALKAAGTANAKIAAHVGNDVVAELSSRGFAGPDDIPDIEMIQDAVEQAFIKRGLSQAAKLYILYRAQHEKLRERKQLMLDIQDLVSSYLGQEDWRVNENSNAGYSYASLLNHVSGAVVANYTLANIYPAEIAEAHNSGDFHLHDLSCGIVGYCAGWSLRDLLLTGFRGAGGRASAAPARHFDTALGQIVNFLCTLQTEWAGAQAFNSFDTLLAPFIRHDRLDYPTVKQAMQQFIFGLNIASRWGQTPFTNLTFDWVVPEDLKDNPVIIGGELQESCYGDYQPEMDWINRAFLEVMSEGDRDGRIFTFPIPTYNITRDFNWTSENARLLFAVTGKYGLPYFQNFINSDLNPGDVRSMCCRLQMDMRELRKKTGGLFGAGEQTGSIGVVTINLPRLGYLAKTEEEFFARLDRLILLAKESLEIKRKVVQKHLEGDLMPYTRNYLPAGLDHHFSTIGLVGMNEAILNFLGCSICDAAGQEFAARVLDHMKEKIQDIQEETGHIYNLEATPAEGTSFRLARLDRKRFPEIICAGDLNPYYTNSTQLPVGYTDDLFEALDLQAPLQSRYTGGTVFHAFIGERIEDPELVAQLVRKIATNYRLPYFTLTPSFSICPVHGYIPGAHENCPLDQ